MSAQNCIDGSQLQTYNDTYCGSSISWTISIDTFNNYELYDQQALAMYRELYVKWKDRGTTLSPPFDSITVYIHCFHSSRARTLDVWIRM